MAIGPHKSHLRDALQQRAALLPLAHFLACIRSSVRYTVHAFTLAKLPMLPEIAPEELAAAVYDLATQLLAEAGILGPPVDAFQLARALGITVALDGVQAGRARFVRLARGTRTLVPTILLRPDPRAERRHWAVAHEVGEHAVWRLFAALQVDPREATPNAREQAANWLAGHLLVPQAWLAVDGPACDWDLLELKARYRTVSHELIARRMLDFPAPVVVTIFDQRQLTFRAGNRGSRRPPLSSIETRCWQEAHRSDRPAQCAEENRRVRAWPIHEAHWKREILRTDLEESWPD